MKKWMIITGIIVILLLIWYFAYGQKWFEKRKRAKQIQDLAKKQGRELSIADAAKLADAESEMSTTAFRTFATKVIEDAPATGDPMQCGCDGRQNPGMCPEGTTYGGCIVRDGQCLTRCVGGGGIVEIPNQIQQQTVTAANLFFT